MGRYHLQSDQLASGGKQGEGQSLTQREAHGLAGEWYLWFVSLHEDEPGTAEQWDLEAERLEDAYRRFAPGMMIIRTQTTNGRGRRISGVT